MESSRAFELIPTRHHHAEGDDPHEPGEASDDVDPAAELSDAVIVKNGGTVLSTRIAAATWPGVVMRRVRNDARRRARADDEHGEAVLARLDEHVAGVDHTANQRVVAHVAAPERGAGER